jgi:hypothetical protein
MQYALGFIEKGKIISEVLGSDGSYSTNPKAFQFGVGKNVGRVLLFCHNYLQAPGEVPKRMVVVVDNREDLKRELEFDNVEFVLIAKSCIPLVQELVVRLPSPPKLKEKEIPYWVK